MGFHRGKGPRGGDFNVLTKQKMKRRRTGEKGKKHLPANPNKREDLIGARPYEMLIAVVIFLSKAVFTLNVTYDQQKSHLRKLKYNRETKWHRFAWLPQSSSPCLRQGENQG